MGISDLSSDVCSSYLKGDRYFVEGNKLQTILDSYFGDKFEKRDGELLISKDFWKDKNKPLSKRFYLLSVMGGMSEVALSAFKLVTLRSAERCVGKECVSTLRSRW